MRAATTHSSGTTLFTFTAPKCAITPIQGVARGRGGGRASPRAHRGPAVPAPSLTCPTPGPHPTPVLAPGCPTWPAGLNIAVRDLQGLQPGPWLTASTNAPA